MICIVHFGSTKTIKIADCLTLLGYKNKIVEWNRSQEVNWDKTSGIILSGAPILLTEVDTTKYIEQYLFLKNYTKPILGICFGHQLLGLLFGASVYKGEAIRKETEIAILLKDNLFEGFKKNVVMMEDHTEGITLPASFIHLASSEKYPVEAMKHSNLNIYGTQFHSEVSGENGLKLLSNFCKLT
jgi:GMP synthase (glutamine-hydrolysing)